MGDENMDTENRDRDDEQAEAREPQKEEQTGDGRAGRRNWLKYAGVGPRRGKAGDKASDGKISGGKITGDQVTSLGSLEAEILGVMWDLGRPVTGNEVAEALLYKRRAAGEEPAAFATVNTILRRLSEKGVLTSVKNQYRTPVYTPTVGRAEMTARVLNNVSVTLFGQSLHGLIPKLTGNIKPGKKGEKPDPAEQQEIERLLEALRKVAGETEPGPGGKI